MRSAAQAVKQERRTRTEADLGYRVGRILDELAHVARGNFPAYALSNAMESVANNYRKIERISTAQRDELLSAVIRAQLGAIKHLPESYSRDQIDAGMQALAGQVMVWAESLETSSLRRRHALVDLDAYARMFRNDLHNISLVQEIERRAWERRDSQIQEFLAVARNA